MEAQYACVRLSGQVAVLLVVCVLACLQAGQVRTLMTDIAICSWRLLWLRYLCTQAQHDSSEALMSLPTAHLYLPGAGSLEVKASAPKIWKTLDTHQAKPCKIYVAAQWRAISWRHAMQARKIPRTASTTLPYVQVCDRVPRGRYCCPTAAKISLL